MVHTACATPSNGDVIAWAERAHFQSIRPEYVVLLDANAEDGLSSAAWGYIATSIS